MAITGAGPAAAQAQQTDSAAAGRTARDYTIPAGPLADALNRFADESGLQLVYDAGIAAGLQTGGVQGSFPPQEALSRLLAGTALTFDFSSPGVVRIIRASARSGATVLAPITVAGQGGPPPQAEIGNLPPAYAGGQVATGGELGLLGNRDVMDTPFNQTNYTAKKIADQQARTVKEVLIDDPSMQTTTNMTGIGGDNMKLRGFTFNSNGLSFGGLYGVMPIWSTMAEMAERVEVLKGPNAMLNGMNPNGSIGGAINVVPKRAPDETLLRFTPSYASTRNLGGHVDVGHRLGRDKQIGVRFNGVYRDGETAVEDNSDERGLALLGLDFQGERVRLSADLGYQHRALEGVVPAVFFAAGAPILSPPDASSNFGPAWSIQQHSDVFGVVRGEVDVTRNITAHAAFGAHEFRRSFYGVNVILNTDANGVGSGFLTRQDEYRSLRSAETGVRAHFDTGPVDHQMAIVASQLEWQGGSATINAPNATMNIFSPADIAPPDIAAPDASKTCSTILSSIAVADTLSILDERVQFTLGIRQQRAAAKNFNAATGAETSSYDESALSPAAALVVKPLHNVSLYGNVIQGLQQGEIVGSTFANAGEAFPPSESTQYEAGVKVDWGGFATTVSAFQITQPSMVTDTATNTRVLDGEQRNRGLEFNFFGELADGIRFLGGAMYVDPILTKTQGGLNDGMEAPQTANVQLRLSGEWDMPFLPGLTLTGRAMYTSSQYADTNIPRRSYPAWSRLDFGARYTVGNAISPTGRPIVVRFNVENVLDEDYWLAFLYRGAPRNFLLSTSFDF